MVADPIIYAPGTWRLPQFARASADPARRVPHFARGSAGPWPPTPLFTALARGDSLSLRAAAPVRGDGSLSLREGALGHGRRPHYLRHLREAGRSVRERQRRSGEAGRSVCEREPSSMVADPIICGISARRVTQFARGSTAPWPPTPLFTTLSDHLGEGGSGRPKSTVKHDTFDAWDAISSIVLRNPAENGPFPRECPPKGAGAHGVFGPSTQPAI